MNAHDSAPTHARDAGPAREHVVHGIAPVFDERSQVLVLGSMPSPKSREAGFFYGHPANRFWRVLAVVFGECVPRDISEKRDMLLRHHIALWDVLASCDIEGASDASIRNARPNDLARVLDVADIRAIACTGAKAAELYRKLCEPELGMPCIALPSTSPANARASVAELTRVYADALLGYLDAPAHVVLPVPEVVRLEQTIAAQGTSLATLMGRAGRAAAKGALDVWAARGGNEPADAPADAPASSLATLPRVAILCGTGNNGGDGWVAARELAAQGCAVTLITPCSAEELRAEPARTAALACMEASPAPDVLVAPDEAALADALGGADVIMDAILGTGFSGDAVRAPFDAWIAAANARREAGALVVAADVPSGLSAQTGKAAKPCVKADVTVTMITSKPGLETPYAFAFCGEVHVAHIAYIEPILDAWAHESASEEKDEGGQEDAKGSSNEIARDANAANAASTASEADAANAEFLRPENEDDDGYDPYSDRRPDPEPLFERDPWS